MDSDLVKDYLKEKYGFDDTTVELYNNL